MSTFVAPCGSGHCGRDITHGTSNAYNYHKCRCSACKTWSRDDARVRAAAQKKAREGRRDRAEKQARAEALAALHEPPGAAGWHVIRCRLCGWIEKDYLGWKVRAAGRKHAHTHVNQILLKEYL